MGQRRLLRIIVLRVAGLALSAALLGSASAMAASRNLRSVAGNGAVVLSPGGGTLDLPGIGGVFGALGYGKTDAGKSDGLRVMSSGVWNAGGRWATGGAAVLFVEIEFSGARTVSFVGDAIAHDAGLRDAVVRSPQLAGGERYTVYVLSGNQPVGTPYDAGTSSGGTLSFSSPLHGISLAPGNPLVIELVPEFRPLPPPAPASTTVPLQSGGGSVPALQFGGYHGTLTYAPNNAIAGTTLTMTNSGGRNIDHAPPPASGTAALYLEASVSGSASVAFQQTTGTATLASPALVNGEDYGVFLFAGGQAVGTPYYAGQPSKHALTFGTPLGNLGIAPGTPLVIELSKGAFAPAYTQYTVPTPGGGIVTGPDGALWFTESSPSAIGRLTTSGVLTSYPTPTSNAGPFEITVGPDNALWFTELSVAAVGRIDMSGNITEYPLGPSDPEGIAAGPDGNLWVTDYDGNGIWRVSTHGHARKFRTSSRAFPVGIAAGPDGALWFTEFGGWIGRITTSGTITNYRIKTRNSRPYSIAQGPDNAMWFTEAGAGKIGRIDMSTAITNYTLGSTTCDPTSIVQGSDGAMWFTEYEGQVVGRITPYGAIARFQLPNGSAPYFITRGPDNAMWFTEESSPSTVTRISVPGFSNARPRTK